MIVFNGETLLTIYEHGFERIARRAAGESDYGGRDEALQADSRRHHLTLSITGRLHAAT